MTTLWDSFNHLLEEAEQCFMEMDFDGAINKISKFYHITAKTEFKNIIDEMQNYRHDEEFKNIETILDLFNLYRIYVELRKQNKISLYVYQLYLQLIIDIYKQKFIQEKTDVYPFETGVFEFYCHNYGAAIQRLNKVIDLDESNVLARVYKSKSLLESKEEKKATAELTKALFFAADQLHADDLLFSPFKILLGNLFSKYGNKESASWLLVFEAWHKNWLILEEDEAFFNLMRQKENGERMLQVKYYQYERYRHFVRCIYLVDYINMFKKNEINLAEELQNYMGRLDPQLYGKFFKKKNER
jgi:hypothetical protein